MKPMTARDLKNSTGEVVRALKRGESILLTFRGKPLGTIKPIGPGGLDAIVPRTYEEAWAAIDGELRESAPHFDSWEEAEAASRGRA